MSTAAATRSDFTVEEYLAAEILADVKHEYLGGAVYATAGAGETHNRIAANLLGVLHVRLRGRPCEPFGSDMKVRLYPPHSATYFYYPDAMIACDPADSGHGWRERPSALFEIISEDTRRVDEREKRLAYLQLTSLHAYVLIEQSRPEVVIIRRDAEDELLRGLDATLRLPSLELEIPSAELYERVAFPA
jgi:Uma2 family endonuclease